MVEASELPFRMLCREFGAQLCYTPMLHSRMMLEEKGYLDEHFSTCAADRPLVAQLCGNDPEVVLAAARLIEDKCDAVDLNLGCPQVWDSDQD
jgi:tRNA-dihydrouridine synthase 1